MPISTPWHRYTVNSRALSPPELLVASCLSPEPPFGSVATPPFTWFHNESSKMSRSCGSGPFCGVVLGGKDPLPTVRERM